MPTFTIKSSDRYMYVHQDGSIQWVKDQTFANTYTSKYQAKRHKQMLDNMPANATVVELHDVAQSDV